MLVTILSRSNVYLYSSPIKMHLSPSSNRNSELTPSTTGLWHQAKFEPRFPHEPQHALTHALIESSDSTDLTPFTLHAPTYRHHSRSTIHFTTPSFLDILGALFPKRVGLDSLVFIDLLCLVLNIWSVARTLVTNN
jgi:hypothetical protein